MGGAGELAAPGGAGLPEAGRLGWRRERVNARILHRDARRWSAWSAWLVLAFSTPGVVIAWLEPLAFPVTLLCLAHAWAVPMVQARRGARSVVPIGSERSAARGGAAAGPEQVALGLLADLIGHEERELLRASGLARHRGRFGTWLVGEQGAILLAGGSRAFCWCVRVSDPDGLPAGDRVAHLLLALREDEEGFATVANLAFCGAAWRLRRHLPAGAAAALRP